MNIHAGRRPWPAEGLTRVPYWLYTDRDLYAEDARLDASLPGGRFRIAGPEQVSEFLASRFQGPGRLVEWSPRLHPAGIALWLERVSDGGAAVRERHYLRLGERGIERHWAYAAPPRNSNPGNARRGGCRRAHGPIRPVRSSSGADPRRSLVERRQ